MNISITFRHLEASEAIKAHATERASKLQRLLRQPMTVKVTLSIEQKREQVAEVRLSSGSDHYEAHEATEDMYASIDRVMDKLERQISSSKGAQESKRRRGGETVRGGIPLDEEGESAE